MRIMTDPTVFTTNELQELYSGYPEVIQMDSTFGTNIHGYKLIHVVCADKYLRTHSVCFGLLSNLLAVIMALFVDFFAKIMGVTAKKTEVVLIDKEEAEHKNIRQYLPSARILLCHFHALQAFGRCPFGFEEL